MDVLMPQLGETVAEGKIVKWFKQAGDAVKPGENLFEIETDKTSMEVPAIAAGTLSDIRFQVGEVAKVGAVVAVIAGAGGGTSAEIKPAPIVNAPAKLQTPFAPAKAGAQAEPKKEPGPRFRGDDRSVVRWGERSIGQAHTRANQQTARDFAYPDMSPWREVRTPERNYGPASIGGRQVTPLARRLASERGIDLNRVTGSGPQGRIVAADIAAAPRASEAAPAASQFYLVVDVDIGRLSAMREEAKAGGAEFSLGDFVTKAWAAALRRAGQGTSADIAVIVDADGRRVTKVIRDAAGKTLTAIAREVGALDDSVPAAAVTSAVRILSTPGIREFSSSVTAPFTSVLAVGAPRRAPVEAADGSVRFVSQMTVTLSCDPRAIDDTAAAALLAIFRSLVENPVTALV
ncbi:MAG: 2-oxo acid dehydrogenase subunit E2 [Proteobacteria bacterium]|nr:2-oxo acid dehydrogenase subunit E2 [Pseudomonadota bacterium]